MTQTRHALALEEGVFALHDPAAIARSLKRSAERSRQRKADPFRSVISMLTFDINRAGDNLHEPQCETLENAKDELRALFGRSKSR